MPLKLELQFSGGMELLFDNIKSMAITLPETSEYEEGKCSIRQLLPYIRDNILKERPELFMDGETVRPGILVLINEADWELEGELDYVLKTGDQIVFISTLHGDIFRHVFFSWRLLLLSPPI